jgi:ATP/maltotriose-dependent transcriptional regulator MalT/DNA-binding SARP family transcriptional activator
MSAVAVEPQIIRTKLYPPRLPEIVARERLLKELEKARSAKLAAIVAGAGYGKSTLAAEFLCGLGCPFVWYQLEDTDSDLSEFLSYLVVGLRGIHPEFGDRTLSHMASAGNVREQSRAILSTFIGELDALIDEELFIALDDFHTVSNSAPIKEAMDFLLGHMLPNLHFLILSRAETGLTLTRLRASRELLELKEFDLCFTPQETTSLFGDIFGMRLSEQDIMALSESTEGWISGLVLFYLTLKGRTDVSISSAIKELGPPATVYDYLSKAVFENQSETLRDFLARTSILSRMNPTFCGELLGIEDAWIFLSHLTEARLFTIPLDDRGSWYRYHHSLGAFLNKTLKESYPPAEVEALHLRAASLWEKDGELEEALYHYMEAGEYENAAAVLENIAGGLIRANRVSFLDRELSRLPQDVLQKHPKLMLYSTQMASLVGDYGRVLAAIRGAVEGYERIGDRERQTQALLGLSEALIVVGRFDETEEINARAREVMDPASLFRYKALALEGMIEVLLGRAGRADHLLDEAVAHADDIEVGGLRSTVLIWCGLSRYLQGRFAAAVDILKSADKLPENAGLTHTHPYLYSVLSRSCTYIDRLEEAVEAADKGVALGEEHGLIPMALFSRTTRAVALAYLGDRERALYDMSIGASLCEGYGTFAEALDSEWFLGEANGLIGNGAQALKHWRRFERIIKPYGEARYLAQAGMVASSIGELGLERAAEEIRDIVDTLAGSGIGIALSYAYSLLLSLKLAAGKGDEAREILDAYVSDFGPDVILRTYTTDTEHLLPFFTDLFAQGRHTGLMDRVYGIGGAKSVPHLKRLERSEEARVAAKARELLATLARETTEPLTVKMLGRLEVSRGGQALSSGDWKSKKALTAFKYLAAHRERGYLPRDVLMELLWPDTPVESAQRNLNAALTSLRKTLEPEASRGESSYLISKGDALRLELGPGGWVDLELFAERLAQAAKAREIGDFDLYFRTLAEAAELYAGDFCSEDLYEDWCSQERESLLSGYVDILVDLATEHLRRGEGAAALARLEEAIVKDPGREELYRKQMSICSQIGDRAGVEEAFRRCAAHLREAYDVSPSPETEELYRRLRQR